MENSKQGFGGSAGGHAWSGRVKPRAAPAERQLATRSPMMKQTARKSAAGPRAWAEQLDSQDQESEDDQAESGEAEEQDLDEDAGEEDEEEEEEEEEKDGLSASSSRVQRAVKRAPPIGSDLHTLSRQEFDTAVVSSLPSKLNQFLESGASLVEMIQKWDQINRRGSGLQRARVGAEVLGVVHEIVSKNFQQSERLVKALIQFQSEAPGKGGNSK